MKHDHDLLIMFLLSVVFAFIVWLDHVDGPILADATITMEEGQCPAKH